MPTFTYIIDHTCANNYVKDIVGNVCDSDDVNDVTKKITQKMRNKKVFKINLIEFKVGLQIEIKLKLI